MPVVFTRPGRSGAILDESHVVADRASRCLQRCRGSRDRVADREPHRMRMSAGMAEVARAQPQGNRDRHLRAGAQPATGRSMPGTGSAGTCPLMLSTWSGSRCMHTTIGGAEEIPVPQVPQRVWPRRRDGERCRVRRTSRHQPRITMMFELCGERNYLRFGPPGFGAEGSERSRGGPS